MITIKEIPNILSKEGRSTTQVVCRENEPLSFYLKDYNTQDNRVILNGRLIKSLDSTYPSPIDEIIITPELKAGVVAGIVAAVKFLVPIFVVGAEIAAVVATVYSIYSALTAKPRKPNFGTSGDSLQDNSPTYGWDGITTIQDVGVPVALVLGEHRIGGNIINMYVSTDGDKTYLHMLISLGEGEFDYIDDIEINDNPIGNFQGVEVHKRYGTEGQDIIPGFEDIHRLYNPGATLEKDVPYIYTTVNNDVEAFEVYFNFLNGLYRQDQDDGSIKSQNFQAQIEYKKSSDSEWIDAGIFSVDVKSRSAVRRIFRKDGLQSSRYDILITKLTTDSTFFEVSDAVIQTIDEIQTDDKEYPYTGLLGLKLLATNQLSGNIPNVTCVVKRKLSTIPTVKNGTQVVAWDEYYWDPGSQKYKLLADDTELSWDGVSYHSAFCANPIWKLYDIFTNSRYGISDFIDQTNLDISYFVEMSQYCEEKVPDGTGGCEKRFRTDAVIDTSQRFADLLVQLSATFRGIPFYSQGMPNPRIDKPESAVQMFGMGNIVAGSFSETWKPTSRPNVIEVQFNDKANNYQRDSIFIEDEESLSAGNPRRVQTISLAVTRASQAYREGRYALRLAKYIERSISFKVGIDALACTAGDVIYLSHDMPQTGLSGRVKSGTSNSITLDQEITIESGKTYQVTVRVADDTIETKTVTNPPGSYTTLNISGSFSQVPQDYDIYIFGENSPEPFRITNITKASNDEIEITADEYIAELHNEDDLTLPDRNYSLLNGDIPQVENLTVTERLVKLNDGTIDNGIDVWFQKPADLPNYYVNTYSRARIYLSSDDGNTWDFVGETTGTNFLIVGNIVPADYKVAVTSVSSNSQETVIEPSPQISITVLGKTAPPSDPNGFDVTQDGNNLHFHVDNHPDLDFAFFRIKKGATWDTGTLIIERGDLSDFTIPIDEIGQINFMCKAVDTSGIESENPAVDLVDISIPPNLNFLSFFDLWSKHREYELSNTEIVKRNDFDSNYARDTLALRTADTWEDRESEGKTWEWQEQNGGLTLSQPVVSSGYFEMSEPHDLGAIFEFSVVVDASYKNVTGGSLAVQISHSEDGISYTAFKNASASATYRARYVKLKFILATANTAHNIFFYDCFVYFSVPDIVVDYGRDTAIPTGGKTILFGKMFTVNPSVKTTIANGVIGIAIVNNKTTDGFAVRCYDLSGNPIGTCEIDWEARGY